MRKELLFSRQHPLTEFSCISMCLLNVRSWNGHLEHILGDKICSVYSSLFCFTETNINDSPIVLQNILMQSWMIGKTP